MIHVCIPMRDEHPLTRALVRCLAADAEFARLVIFDNGTTAPNGVAWLRAVEAGRFGARVSVKRRPRATIYQMWNEAWRDALDAGRAGAPVELALLNNDIEVLPGFLGHLAQALRRAPDDVWITYPDWRRMPEDGLALSGTLTPTRGTWRQGGMSGFAFMLKPEKHLEAGWPFIDERFRWLCGDGDLVQQMQRLGATAARVDGLPVRHLHRATSTNGRNTWTALAGQRDLALSRAKYGAPHAQRPR